MRRMFDKESRGLPYRLILSVVLVSTILPPASAQSIDTNRPGFSFSPNIVAPGRWQLETGVGYIRVDSDTDAISLPTAELRYGVTDDIEVFASSLTWTSVNFPGGDTSGLEDMALGAKVNISSPGAQTNMALLLAVSVPIGDNSFSSDRWDPGLAFVWAHDGAFTIAGTIAVSDSADGVLVENGLKLPFSLGDTSSVFVEWEADLPEEGGSTHWLNGGYQWLLDDSMQLDINAGLGLNDRAGDYRLGAGFSVLFME